MIAFETWQYEWIYYLYPKMDTSGDNIEQIQSVLKATSFELDDAKAFKAGFEVGQKILRESVQRSLDEPDRDL